MKLPNKPSFNEEKSLWDLNIDYVIGVDEVGRGAFAGPIVAAAVVFPKSIDQNIPFLSEVNDSKIIPSLKRKELAKEIMKYSLFAVESIDLSVINRLGIGKANKMVFRKAVKSLLNQIGSDNFYLLFDGYGAKYVRGGRKKQKAIVKGDRISLSIASASIIAKVHRDNLMVEAERNFPNYGFSRNKGYGTKKHREALNIYGISKFHRTSFNLVRSLNLGVNDFVIPG
jgi:ribonuclease HII